MSDLARGLPEPEAPVNPYSLLESVNGSSDSANTAWIIFLAMMAYFTIAVAGISHKDLLLNSAVPLPILQVQIELTRFFMFAPFVLALLHLGVLVQHVLLARKVLEFDSAVRMLEPGEERSHPLRLELHSYFFPQALAGPSRSRVMGSVLHGMSWLTLVVLPVLLILYIQVVFLPYHDVRITWAHRIALAADIVVLIAMGVFLTRSETTFFGAVGRVARQHPLSTMATVVVMVSVTVFSFFVATVPGEALDRRGNADSEGNYLLGFVMPFLGATPDGTLFGIFHRNIVATDVQFVSEKDAQQGEATVVLRNRDLKGARLDRSKLINADFTGADLEGASLSGADLRNAKFGCVNLLEVVYSQNREAARCAAARRANFTKAKMGGASLEGIDLRGAKLNEAELDNAVMRFALLTGADFSSAHLERADLTGDVALQGAIFQLASLQGTDFTGAKLQNADFSSAAMQGAILHLARMQGAALRDADLDGADLSRAKLQGADLTGAKLRGADLRGAYVWQTAPPAPENSALADITELTLQPLDESELTGLNDDVSRIMSERVKKQVKDAIAGLIDAAQTKEWMSSPQIARWRGLQSGGATSQSETYRPKLTDYLVDLMCRLKWSNAGIATGVTKRAMGERFKGDRVAIYDRVRAESCPASKTISGKLVRELSLAVDSMPLVPTPR